MVELIVLILAILCVYLIFKYMGLKKEIMSCQDQIEYIQENNSSMRISSSIRYKPLLKIIKLFETQREDNKSLYVTIWPNLNPATDALASINPSKAS